MIKAYVDAATKGNPGPSGGGFTLVTNQQQIQKHFPLPELSNHQAEFLALITLLDYLIEQHLTNETVMVYSDSKVLIQAIDKNYTNNPDFITYLATIKEQIFAFSLIIFQWIPEKQNKGADHLARQGLQKALKTPKKNRT
ncbi:MAG: ribonuclease HI family protein [Enterococcus sp.]